jgi:hypothetical protein
MVELESPLVSLALLGETSLIRVLSKRSLEVVFSSRNLLSNAHSLSVAPEPLAIWDKKLEGLRFLSLERLKITSKDMYPAAPEHISRFFYSRRTRIEVLLSCSQIACFLSEVGGRWWLSINAAQSRVVQCWHIVLDIPFSSTVFMHGYFFFTAFCHFFESFFRFDLLVH